MNKGVLFLPFFVLFLPLARGEYNYDHLKIENANLSILLSHNIHGETKPCGHCTNPPLGGFSQAANKIQQLKKKREVFYIDTGDSLFPPPLMSDLSEKKRKAAAKKVALALDHLGLKYMLPGDYEWSAGIPFLKELLKEVRFRFLISNLKDEKQLPHKRWVLIQHKSYKIFLIGLVDPQLLNKRMAQLFISPEEAVKKLIPILKQKGFQKERSNHRLILLSHAGMEADKKTALRSKHIHWILGGHSMDFSQRPEEVGNVHLAQVRSRNHYLGELILSFSPQKQDKWVLHPVEKTNP